MGTTSGFNDVVGLSQFLRHHGVDAFLGKERFSSRSQTCCVDVVAFFVFEQGSGAGDHFPLGFYRS